MKKLGMMLLIFVLTFSFGACSKNEIPRESSALTDTTEQVKSDIYRNRLTGKEGVSFADYMKRPVAITVNNIAASLPQYGISEGDIVFEFPVEGGITRLMVLYAEDKVPSVCSVRSCRYYFPLFAKGFDAIYFCYGSNELLANPTLESCGIDYIDGARANDSMVFGRDPERLKEYSSEHTVYFKGENIEDIIENYSFRKEINYSESELAFNFVGQEESVRGEKECRSLTVSFSEEYFSRFDFEISKGVYLKTHSQNNHIDSKTGKQLSFKNLFLLFAQPSFYKDTNLVTLNCDEGEGFYVTEATAREIKWKREEETGKLKFFSSEGEELKVNCGKSYIAVGMNDISFDFDVDLTAQ